MKDEENWTYTSKEFKQDIFSFETDLVIYCRSSSPITELLAPSSGLPARSVDHNLRKWARPTTPGKGEFRRENQSQDKGQHFKSDKSRGVIGVCALDHKTRTKTMRNLLDRLISNGEFKVVVFGDTVILDEGKQSLLICSASIT